MNTAGLHHEQQVLVRSSEENQRSAGCKERTGAVGTNLGDPKSIINQEINITFVVVPCLSV